MRQVARRSMLCIGRFFLPSWYLPSELVSAPAMAAVRYHRTVTKPSVTSHLSTESLRTDPGDLSNQHWLHLKHDKLNAQDYNDGGRFLDTV